MTRILLVEDSKTQAEQIVAAFRTLKIDVVVAHDGPEGLALAVELKPDCIILDVELPTMDGFQVCRRLRRDELTNQIPIIMLTDKTHPRALLAGVSAGADDYISKDIFAVEHLLTTMETLQIVELQND